MSGGCRDHATIRGGSRQRNAKAPVMTGEPQLSTLAASIKRRFKQNNTNLFL